MHVSHEWRVFDNGRRVVEKGTYRKPMAPDEIMAILEERAAQARADPAVVAVVADDLANCHRIALCCEA